MKVVLANPRGFCAGVRRAISIVEQALDIYGSPIYVYHEIVHNSYVVDNFRARGAIFIENVSEVPDGSVLILSAHGVSKSIRKKIYNRNLIVFDGTCPLVTKVHMEVIRASRQGVEVVLIGHAGHPEVEGTMGQYSNPAGGIYLVEAPQDVWRINIKDIDNLCYLTQTTLSVHDSLDIINTLQNRFPNIKGPRKNDICYATINRQEEVRNLAFCSDMILVVGSKNSSNSNRLAELARRLGKDTYLIDRASEIQINWLYEKKIIGVTAGASAPDILVDEVIKRLCFFGAQEIQELSGRIEQVVFEIPKELRLAKDT